MSESMSALNLFSCSVIFYAPVTMDSRVYICVPKQYMEKLNNMGQWVNMHFTLILYIMQPSSTEKG